MSDPAPASVFIVDDDRGLVRLIERSLRREGHAISCANSAEEAIAYLGANVPDLMLLDLKLGAVGAGEIIDQLAASDRLVPFIIITGQGDERVAVEMMKRGALDYLVKDVNFQEFVPAFVRRALDQIDRDRKLVTAERERHRLEQQIIEISDQERRRIGQDLHDGLGQHLTGIELMIEALEQKLGSKGKSKTEAARASEIARHVREAIRQTRALARGLSPVETESNGLMAAITGLADNATKMFRVQCEFICPEPVLISNNTAATHLFRIAQEALSNAVKHGRAHRVEILLTQTSEAVCLVVKNDGAAMTPPGPRSGGLGLRIMKYRASVLGGWLEIQNGNPNGTVVSCELPKATLESIK